MHNQPTAVVPEIAADILPQAPTVEAGPGDAAVQTNNEQPSIPPAVCVYIVACTSSA